MPSRGPLALTALLGSVAILLAVVFLSMLSPSYAKLFHTLELYLSAINTALLALATALMRPT